MSLNCKFFSLEPSNLLEWSDAACVDNFPTKVCENFLAESSNTCGGRPELLHATCYRTCTKCDTPKRNN